MRKTKIRKNLFCLMLVLIIAFSFSGCVEEEDFSYRIGEYHIISKHLHSEAVNPGPDAKGIGVIYIQRYTNYPLELHSGQYQYKIIAHTQESYDQLDKLSQFKSYELGVFKEIDGLEFTDETSKLREEYEKEVEDRKKKYDERWARFEKEMENVKAKGPYYKVFAKESPVENGNTRYYVFFHACHVIYSAPDYEYEKAFSYEIKESNDSRVYRGKVDMNTYVLLKTGEVYGANTYPLYEFTETIKPIHMNAEKPEKIGKKGGIR